MKKILCVLGIVFLSLSTPSIIRANASDDIFLKNHFSKVVSLVAKADQSKERKLESGKTILLDVKNSQSFYEELIKEIILLRIETAKTKPSFEFVKDDVLLYKMDKLLNIAEKLAFNKIVLIVADKFLTPFDEHTYNTLYCPASDNVEIYKYYLRHEYLELFNLYKEEKK